MSKATTTPKKKANQKPSAQLIDGDKTSNLPIEEMPNLPVPSKVPQELTADEKAAQEVQRFDVARAWIAEKKEAYTGLTIAGVDDKDGIKTVHAAWQEIRAKRLAVSKTHTLIKADYLTITRAIDKEKNDLTSLLEEIENPLKDELDRIEAIKEEEKKKAEREKAEKLQGRVNELLNSGMAFNGSYYAIGASISMDVVTLQNMSDMDYATFLGRVQAENEAAIKLQQEKEQREREEREALELQRQQQEEQQRKLQAQQKTLQDQQDAIDKQRRDMLAARTKARGKMLEVMGLIYNFSSNEWAFKTADFGNITMPLTAVQSLEEESWENELSACDENVKQIKASQAEKDKEKTEAIEAKRIQQDKERAEAEAKRVLIGNRKAELMAYYGMAEQSDGSFIRRFKFETIAALFITKSQIENYEAEPWAAELKSLEAGKYNALKLQEDLQKLEDEATEAARVASLSDRDRVNEYLRTFAEATGKRPQITDKRIKKAWDAFDKVVAGAVEDLTLVLDNIK